VKKAASFLASAGFVLLAAGCRPAAEETRFLNFDPESTAGALTSGWSGYEKTATGDTFVWCQGGEAKIKVTSLADGDRLLRIRAWAFVYPGAIPQTVTVFVNDTKVETLTMAGDPRVYTVAAPQLVWHRGTNDIRFVFAYAEAPKDRLPGSTDPRSLSACFDWLEILSPGKDAKKK
jgi:hypothetical protein